jgi:MFS family permease
MAGWMMAWAIVSTLMAVVKNYHGMLACRYLATIISRLLLANCGRFVLGITEAPFYPGAVYMISIFYARKETATRLSIFYTGNLMASAFSGLIAAPVFAGLDGKHGLEGWRWLFLIQGVITSTPSVLFMIGQALAKSVSQLPRPFLRSSYFQTRLERPGGSPPPNGNWHIAESPETLLRRRTKSVY